MSITLKLMTIRIWRIKTPLATVKIAEVNMNLTMTTMMRVMIVYVACRAEVNFVAHIVDGNNSEVSGANHH